MKQIIRTVKRGLIAGLWLAACAAHAVNFIQTEQLTLAENDVFNEETWASADAINLSGTASNNLFTASLAGTTELDGTFQKDVWTIADQVFAAGTFDDSLRVMARIVDISGSLQGTLLAVGTTVTVTTNAQLEADAVCVGDTVIFNGSSEADVQLIAKHITLGGQIQGSVELTSPDIVILPNTVIDGDLTYTTAEELFLSKSITLNGKLIRAIQTTPSQPMFKQDLLSHFLFFLGSLVAGLVFFALFPRIGGTACAALANKRGSCTLIGVAALVLVPVTALSLMLTIIVMPLSVIALAFYGILLYFARIVVAITLGVVILRRTELTKRTIAAPLALGLLIIYAATCITAAALAINIMVSLLGLGALLIAIFKNPVLVIQSPTTTNNNSNHSED